jgi:two-component system OmpR family sensor kinase
MSANENRQDVIRNDRSFLGGARGGAAERARETVADSKTWRGESNLTLAVAAYEIRTPLNALRLQLQLAVDSLRGRTDLPREFAQHLTAELRRAIASTHQIGRLVDDFADISLTGAAKLRLQRRQLDLVALIREVIERTRKLADGCPPIKLTTPVSIFGLWDATRIDQVVSNLLNNAVRFSDGRPIEVVAYANDRTARIEVRDHGVGIPQERFERIFELFESGDPTNRSHLGIGLWVVREALEAMGGKISVSSTVGKGTNFVIEVPCR